MKLLLEYVSFADAVPFPPNDILYDLTITIAAAVASILSAVHPIVWSAFNVIAENPNNSA